MDPFEVLGVPEDADDAAVQAAWLEAVRRSPPDRDPAGFQEARQAWELIRDEASRRRLRLFGLPLPDHFVDLAPKQTARVPILGLEVWRALLAERRD